MSARYRFIVDPVQSLIRRFFKAFGYEILRMGQDYTADEVEVFERVRLFTGTSTERIAGLMSAVNYIIRNQIEGDFIECGVWRGGSMMAAMLTLLRLGDTSRHFYLYDTYTGMTPPTSDDVSFDGQKASALLATTEKKEGATIWCIAGLEDVQRNVWSTGYPKDKIHFIKGRVEDTLPEQAPQRIALLRLDTDWYESTRHELIHLYPRLCPRGIMILDDYGHWQGARRAVDEYFTGQTFAPLLNKLDLTGRLVVKPG
jgi:O-methyltransferase